MERERKRLALGLAVALLALSVGAHGSDQAQPESTLEIWLRAGSGVLIHMQTYEYQAGYHRV